MSNSDGGCKGAEAIRETADDISTASGLVAATCATVAGLTFNPVAAGCAGVAGAVSIGSSLLQTAVSCADWDRQCRNSALASGLNLATAGVGGSIWRSLGGADEGWRFFGGIVYSQIEGLGWLLGRGIDTEQPADCIDGGSRR